MLKIFGYASAIQLILQNAIAAAIFCFSAAECRIGGEGVEVEIDESK